MKKIFFAITILFLGLITFSTQAQELAVLKSGTVIDSVIQNAKISEWTGDKSVYVIEFDIANNLEKDQGGIRYSLELYNSTKEQGKFLVDQRVYDEVINLNPKGRVLKRVQYDFPVSFQGEYELQLLLATEDGVELDRKILGNISKDNSEGIFIDITKCQSKIGFDDYHIFKEVDLSGGDSFEIQCKDIENLIENDLSFYSKVIIKDQTKFGEIVEEKKLEKQILKSEEVQNFSFQVPAVNNSSYRYEGELFLVDENQEKISNSIYFSYVIKKDENGEVIQDPNEISEVMEVNQTDSEAEGIAFPVLNIVVIVVLSVALLVVLILVFHKFK